LIPATETDEGEHIAAHDPTNALTPPADEYVF
jgi:hypothetical protein